MQLVSVSLLAAASLLASQAAGQANLVPPPPCLYNCILAYGNCALCTPSGNSQITSCIDGTCGYQDVTYAGAYYNSICSDGGYQDYAVTPTAFIAIPPTGCVKATPPKCTKKA